MRQGPRADRRPHPAWTALSILLLCLLLTPRISSGEANVAPDINRPYKSADLDVRMWAERFTGESREVFLARHEVVEALALEPGMRIADVGAGTGLYVQLFAAEVGREGRVYAVDIAPQFLDFIADNAYADGLTQVITVLGEDKRTNLKPGSVDVIFHSDTYHHFEYPQTIVADMLAALTPGGEMWVLDFERIEGVSAPWTLDHVRAGKRTVIEEITAAGFELVGEVELPGLVDNYLLRFRKPFRQR